MKFSERHGYKPVRDAIQFESMDSPLKNRLWSLLKIYCWDEVRVSSGIYARYYISDSSNKDHFHLCSRLWINYFDKPLDELDNDWSETLPKLRNYYFGCEWYEVYDFIEFVANNYNKYGFRDRFIAACNAALEKEMSAYRFVDGIVAPIVSSDEIEEVEEAISASATAVTAHLRRALELLSDRERPDYRNSIKESISAVEALAILRTGDKGTLGQLIKTMDDSGKVHPALKSAFSALYGYTSDEEGIRHAMLESSSVDFDDARFMLIACSAFTNYVQGKLNDA